MIEALRKLYLSATACENALNTLRGHQLKTIRNLVFPAAVCISKEFSLPQLFLQILQLTFSEISHFGSWALAFYFDDEATTSLSIEEIVRSYRCHLNLLYKTSFFIQFLCPHGTILSLQYTTGFDSLSCIKVAQPYLSQTCQPSPNWLLEQSSSSSSSNWLPFVTVPPLHHLSLDPSASDQTLIISTCSFLTATVPWSEQMQPNGVKSSKHARSLARSPTSEADNANTRRSLTISHIQPAPYSATSNRSSSMVHPRQYPAI